MMLVTGCNSAPSPAAPTADPAIATTAGPAAPGAVTTGPAAPGSTVAVADPAALQAGKTEPTPSLGTTDLQGGAARGQGVEAIMLTAKWCYYCKVMKDGAWGAGKRSYPGMKFRELDVDELEAEAKAIGWQGLPTFVFRKGGREVTRFAGSSEEKLKSILASLGGGV